MTVRVLMALVTVLALGGAGAGDAVAATGDLTQKPGTAGCISNNGVGPCVDGTALDNDESITVSPDGTSAYVAATESDAVAIFDRAADGTLTQKPGTAGCISDTGAGPCASAADYPPTPARGRRRRLCGLVPPADRRGPQRGGARPRREG